jgi:hypothetical protein
MSAISDATAGLQTALNALVPAIVDSVNRKVAAAGQADNALALNGQTATQLTATAAAHTDAHAALTNNPHGVTAHEVGAYTQAEIDSTIAALIPSGLLPISTFGNVNGDVSDYITVNGSAGTVNFSTAGIPLIMAGQAFILGTLSISIQKGATNKLYAQLVGGVPQFVSSTTAIPETSTNMYIGSVTLDASGNVTANTIAHVVRVDNYRISTSAVGGGIPVSTGTPDQTGNHLAWT